MTGHPSLREALQQYLSLRRALGFKLKTTGRLLGQFVDYLEAQSAVSLTVDHALAWARLFCVPAAAAEPTPPASVGRPECSEAW